VGTHDLEEIINGLGGLVETSVLSEDLEEVLGDIRGGGLGRGLGKEGVDAGRLVRGREDGVGEEILDRGLGLDGGLDSDEVGLDLLEGGGAVRERRSVRIDDEAARIKICAVTLHEIRAEEA
jgi:hypothetical protein